MPIEISIRSNIKEISKKLSAVANRQLPFATASALTELAKEVQADEVSNMAATFKSPKPFTLRSVGVQGARKDRLEAKVFVRPIAARYLQPYETGGVHMLPGRALLNPKNIQLNQYGQLPAKVLARLKARSDVFVGPVKTKAGIVNGVWQRPAMVPARSLVRGGPKLKQRAPRGANVTGQLKLLIRFGDALPVKKHLNYRSHAEALINRRFNAVFGAALGRALSSAR